MSDPDTGRVYIRRRWRLAGCRSTAAKNMARQKRARMTWLNRRSDAKANARAFRISNCHTIPVFVFLLAASRVLLVDTLSLLADSP